MSTKTAALIVAAGRGERLKSDLPKAYVPVGGISMLRRTIEVFLRHPAISLVQVVISPEHRGLYEEAVKGLSLLPPVAGGKSRQESVLQGLEALKPHSPSCVLIHDAARPFLSPGLISHVCETLQEHEAVLPVLPVRDTIKQLNGSFVAGTVPREQLAAAQTPQGFHFASILKAHREFAGIDATDDAAIAESAGIAVHVVAGDAANIKITTPEDLMGGYEIRTGSGIDVHPFRAFEKDEARSIALCGVQVPCEFAVAGHSDADVGLHALVDALLGTIGAGDIGVHFPPSDARWKGADSAQFVQHALSLVRQRGGSVVNVDLTILCEQPKVGPHRDAMQTRIAQLLEIAPDRVNIKATTTEKLGFLGRSEGLAAQAIATVKLGE